MKSVIKKLYRFIKTILIKLASSLRNLGGQVAKGNVSSDMAKQDEGS